MPFRKRYIPLLCLPLIAAGMCIVYFSHTTEKIVHIWTDQSAFASYAELFNASQDSYHVIVEYKASPVTSFPAVQQPQPDIVIGTWLKNEKVRKNFLPLEYLFDDIKLSAKDFYPQLLELGNIKNKQYLLPVSFNLPVIIFSEENQQFVDDNFMLSVAQIREAGKNFNVQNKNGSYSAMGFSPRWNADFMYVVSKLFDTQYAENKVLFSFDETALQNAVAYLRSWSADNTSTVHEDDFQFKYLYNPVYKLVTSGKCLFGYTKSDELFALPSDRLQNIDFRWIHQNNNIAVADKLIYMGVYRKTANLDGAQAFILWFLNEHTQKQLLERSVSMNLSTKSFGISGGFSSIKNVNERFFPLSYPLLYGHLPTADYLSPPNILPARWEDIKKRVVIPYLEEVVAAETPETVKDMETRMKSWVKMNY